MNQQFDGLVRKGCEENNVGKKIHRVAAYTLAGFLALSSGIQPMTAYAGPASGIDDSGSGNGNSGQTSGGTNSWGTPGGSPSSYNPNGSVAGAIARGIDLSYWNQNVDWNQVATDNVQFAMLATRFRGQQDPFFAPNATGAYQNGMKIGAYIYSYATTPAMAEQDADFILNVIKDYPISFPVVFDAEDANTLGTLSPSEVSDVINAFCRKIEAAGYHPMVYANEYWLNNKIDMSRLNYDIWVARYADAFTYHNTSMWQASNTGSVKGVNGNVDINYLYKDFSSVIPANTWRTIGGNRYYYSNHVMQKSAWIHDGQNWYFMNEAGNPLSGWQTINGAWYYLEGSGAMASNWKQLDGVWYYLAGDGAMRTSWQDIGGTWYYLGTEGRMQTGWQTINGSNYYLEPSGAMASNWKQLDGIWYYLAGDGAMRTGWQDVSGARYYLGTDGRMQTGWQTIDGALYYLDSASGAMAVNAVLDYNGVPYQAGADGICVQAPADTQGAQDTAGGTVPNTPSGPAGPGF